MATLATRNNQSAPVRTVRDPFSMARELLSWDPFFGGRQITAFAPAFEVKETTDAFVLKADLPGVAEADLDIGVHNNVLTVSGSRSAEDRKEGESYALYERQFGSFTRSFSLPDIADGEKIDANLSNGVLTLSIAKKAQARPRKIELKKHEQH
ncbi:Hsp20/alpha crystallin family protein [soil metagenome]